MNSIIITLLLGILSIQASAESRKVIGEELETYKRAVNAAFHPESFFTCRDSGLHYLGRGSRQTFGHSNISELISKARIAYVSEATQPTVTFMTESIQLYEVEGESNLDISIFTDDSKKQVTNISIHAWQDLGNEVADINDRDLLTPGLKTIKSNKVRRLFNFMCPLGLYP